MGRPSRYPAEFRREAVELYRSSDRPRCQVAASLGISDGSLAAWVKEVDAADEPGALDLLAWAVSAEHLLLRATLGLRPAAEAQT